MTRDVRGRPVLSDKDEKVRGQKETAKEESAGKQADPHEHLDTCDDCMKIVAKHAGSSGKADGMASEDQEKGKPSAKYERRRH